MVRALLLCVFAASLAHASPRHDQFTLGVTGGAMFPSDAAYGVGPAPELGVVGGYSPEWGQFRLDLSAFWTAGQSGEEGVSALCNWLFTDAPSSFFLGGGLGLDWLGVDNALANQTGWHLLEYPEVKPHALLVAFGAGLELGRGTAHPWMLGAELHLPFDYLKVHVRFPSVLGSVKVAF
jgi:hypothetical protein